MNKQILLVIVLFKCDYRESNTYKTFLIKNQHFTVFTFDNSPIPQIIDDENIIYSHHPENPGLGRAYNEAAEYAIKHGYEWILIMDQDTMFPPHAMEYYENAINNNPGIMLFAPIHKIAENTYISPTHYRFKTSHPEKSPRSGLLSLKNIALINSGMLINVEAFNKVGGYDEEVMLDFSDTRFIEKFKKFYSVFYAIDKIVCLQEYSIVERDKNKIMARYKIYLKCALACKREHFYDHLSYLYITCRRTMKWILRTHSLSFIKTYFTDYIAKII